ncbi:MAG: ribonuclease J [Chloroflexota bacterium]
MPKLRIIPLGGLGEIGKNMTVIEYGNSIIIIDAGIMFPRSDMHGVDFILPDWQYLLDKKDSIKGIVITHGHEDHIGALGHLVEEFDVPIYATLLTQGLVKSRLQRRGKQASKLITMRPRQQFKLGPFRIDPFRVCHSIPDGVGLGIYTPVGLVVHSGDYKFDHTPVDGRPPDFAKLAEFANQGVLVLLADSTNSDKPGWTPSEAVIDGAFDQVMRDSPGRVIVASFASLISRIQQVILAAQRHGRKVAVAGRSMVDNTNIARQLGYLDYPGSMRITVADANKMPPEQVVIMTTGTQGEPMAGLGRLALNRHRSLSIEKDDTVVISAHPIPGNEEMVYQTINYLFQRGAHVIYDAIAPVHVSGHASREEQKLLINLLRPKFLVPIHGELRHLTLHGELAQELGIEPDNIVVVENGHILEFDADSVKVRGRVPGTYVYVDGAIVGDIGPSVLRERRTLSREGFIVAVIHLDSKGRMVGDADLITRGIASSDEAPWLFDGIQKAAVEAVKQSHVGDEEQIEQNVSRSVSKYLRSTTGSRPMVFTVASCSS